MINVVIPSYGRADAMVGKDYFSYASYVIPESQRDEYAKNIASDRLIVIPDSCDGNIVKKRNWILKNIPRPLLMLDDDVRCLMMTEGMHQVKDKEHMKAIEKIRLTPDEAWNVIATGFEMCEEFGARMWGLNINTDGRNYQQYLPIRLNQIILGPFQGHLDHDLEFDEDAGAKEDYDMALQQLRDYKKILRFNKYSYDCDHGDNKGGIVSMRTMEKEIGWGKYLMEKWGTKIIKYPLFPKNMASILNGQVKIPIRGV